MKKLFSLFILLSIATLSVGCSSTSKTDDANQSGSSVQQQVAQKTNEDVVVQPEPELIEVEESVKSQDEFDPDQYKDPEIDTLIAMLEGYTE